LKYSAANGGFEPILTDAARCMSGRNLSKWVIRKIIRQLLECAS
jgi:hypothetical protein